MHKEMVDNLLDQADSLIAIDRANEALSVLQEAARLAPDSAYVMCRFSRAYISLNDWNAALHYANMAVVAAPDEAWGHRLCSIALRNMGNPQEAMRAASAAVQLTPEDATCIRLLAHAQIECEFYGPAEENAWRAVHLDPDQAECYVMLARLYYRQKRWKLAEEHARTALKIDPNSVTAIAYLADSVANGRGKRQALPYYVQVLQVQPTNVPAQKLVLDTFSNLPYFVVPSMLILLWVLFVNVRMSIPAAFGTALVASVVVGAMFFRFWPKVLLYPQPSFWKLPASYREFVLRTWQKEWLKRSGNVMVMTGLMLGIIVVTLIAAVGIAVAPGLGPLLLIFKYSSKPKTKPQQPLLARTISRFRP